MTARRLIPLLLAAMVLPACAADYSADVANHSQRPVFAAIFEQSPKAGFKMLSTGTIPPDGQKTVGPVKPVSDASSLFIIIDTSPNAKSGRRISLSKGTTRFEVVQFGDDPKAPIQVNQLP
jgi:hypothetical protein